MMSICSHSYWYHIQDLQNSLSLLHLLNSQCPSYPQKPQMLQILLDDTVTLLGEQKAQPWRKYLQNMYQIKDLLLHIFLKLSKLSNNKVNSPIKNCQNILTHTKDIQWPINI